MPRLAFALCLLATGCSAVGTWSVDVRNGASEVLFVTGSSSGPSVDLFVDVEGEWRSTAPSEAWLCLPRCDRPPGMVACADIAMAPPVVWAMPAGAVEAAFEGERWYQDINGFGACARQARDSATLQARICASREAVDENGEPLVAPASGVPEGGDFGSELVNPECFTGQREGAGAFEVVVEAPAT
mgnify:CR=1 FL=1